MLNGSHHKALSVAKALFAGEGYHTRFLEDIERYIDRPDPEEPIPTAGYRIEPHGFRSNYRVLDRTGELVCITVYKKGAVEVARRLNANANPDL